MKQLRISLRLMLFVPVLVVTLAVAVSFCLSELKQSLVNDRKEAIRNIVQIGQRVVETWHAKQVSGELSREGAQKGARDELWGLRFAEGNYFFVQRYDGVTMLQANRELEGKNRIDVTDPDGVPTVRRQIEAAQRGGDFVRYRNPRLGGITSTTKKENFLPKLSYCAGFAPWEWAICSGIYIDDVDTIYATLLLRYCFITILLLIAGSGVAYLLARSISRPLMAMTKSMARLADGDLAVDIPEAERRDEIGDMARAMRVFKENAVAKLELEVAMNHADRIDALGRLAGGIAHDLNNALVPVLAMTKSVMGRMPAVSRDRTGLELVLTGASRAKDLVQQILAFCRKQPIEMRDMDLAQVTIDAIKMLRASLPTIKLASTVDTVPNIYGDPGQLYQVLINLVTNASHAIGDQPGTVTVTLENADSSHIRLSVADDGCGMDEQTMARIFEPFYTTKEAGKGTGLGLSLVHGIITAHRGTISVESTVGKGARFEILLPVAASAQGADDRPFSSALAVAASN